MDLRLALLTARYAHVMCMFKNFEKVKLSLPVKVKVEGKEEFHVLSARYLESPVPRLHKARFYCIR